MGHGEPERRSFVCGMDGGTAMYGLGLAKPAMGCDVRSLFVGRFCHGLALMDHGTRTCIHPYFAVVKVPDWQ